ncbi:Cytochrome c oxidase subunit 6A, mitochondrial [Actinomortierella ambigua]|nr:Cytochrome c oxidase subunit 6A, mitochondrial [Actinomortierella ambigua]
MASRIASAAKGIRFASTAAAESNPWLAERIARKEHAGPSAETWRKISIFVCMPAIVASTANAYRLYAEHQEHMAHHPPEKIKYPYMRLRARAFPWGDDSLFFNPAVNM